MKRLALATLIVVLAPLFLPRTARADMLTTADWIAGIPRGDATMKDPVVLELQVPDPNNPGKARIQSQNRGSSSETIPEIGPEQNRKRTPVSDERP
jgi:hypothetical protein